MTNTLALRSLDGVLVAFVRSINRYDYTTPWEVERKLMNIADNHNVSDEVLRQQFIEILAASDYKPASIPSLIRAEYLPE